MTPYSRDNPSADYVTLLNQYRQMHSEGFSRDTDIEGDFSDPDHAFPGKSLHRWLAHVASIISITKSKNVLDYGSGKGLQYEFPVVNGSEVLAQTIQEFWGIEEIACFDPGVPELDVLPNRRFGGVVATDVLEHIPESDVFWVVDELFSLAEHFVFASIPCVPAAAVLPDGRNAHITLKPPLWWLGVFQSTQARYPSVYFFI